MYLNKIVTMVYLFFDDSLPSIKLVRLGKQIKSQLIDGDTACLEISTVSPLHEGLYTCTAFNELGQDSTSARLIILSGEFFKKKEMANKLCYNIHFKIML